MSDALVPSVPVVKPEARTGVQMSREEFDAVMASLDGILKTLREVRDKRPTSPPAPPLGPIW